MKKQRKTSRPVVSPAISPVRLESSLCLELDSMRLVGTVDVYVVSRPLMLVVTVVNDVVEDSEEVELLVVIGVAVVSEDAVVGSVELKMIVVGVLVANSAVVVSVLGMVVSKESSVNVSALVAGSVEDEIALYDLINDFPGAQMAKPTLWVAQSPSQSSNSQLPQSL